MRKQLMMRGLTIAGVSGLLAFTASAAAINYNINLNTAPLIAHAAGPFSLNFQLTDGSGTNDANNTVTLSGFQFGTGGSAVGSPTRVGGATGTLGSTVTLTDSAFLNSFTQQFTPGNRLSFMAQVTTNVDAGPQPDEFSFAILDRTGTELPTASSFFDVFVTIDIDSPTSPTVWTFGSDATRIPAGGGPPITIGAAQVQAVPEPAAGLLLGCGLLLFSTLSRKKPS